MDFTLDTGSLHLNIKGYSKLQDKQLNTYDWLADIPQSATSTDYVEVQFKNSRKGYFVNSAHLPLEKGDMVAVEATPGHDIGIVSLVGKLVLLQMKKNNVRTTENVEPKKIYRKARQSDLDKYNEAKAKEHDTMIRSRQIASNLGLNMKIGDVEYQGDGNKAIFYYIADERVDFRQLIKVLAETFRVKIEMKQIGARQEAGRIGGIGPCGRELCCSGWLNNFVSVATSAARYQDISTNPQKLAGQCAKLKCCLNYEVDDYVEALHHLPSREMVLETKDNTYYHFKTDVFKQEITYSTDKSIAANLVTISAERAFDVIAMNKKGSKPISLEADTKQQPPKRDAQDILGQDSLSRFDANLKKKKKKRIAKPVTDSAQENGTPAANGESSAPAAKEGRDNSRNRDGRPRQKQNNGMRNQRNDSRQDPSAKDQRPRNNQGNRNRNDQPRNNRPQRPDQRRDQPVKRVDPNAPKQSSAPSAPRPEQPQTKPVAEQQQPKPAVEKQPRPVAEQTAKPVVVKQPRPVAAQQPQKPVAEQPAKPTSSPAPTASQPQENNNRSNENPTA